MAVLHVGRAPVAVLLIQRLRPEHLVEEVLEAARAMLTARQSLQGLTVVSDVHHPELLIGHVLWDRTKATYDENLQKASRSAAATSKASIILQTQQTRQMI